jgi:hypothetical protein
MGPNSPSELEARGTVPSDGDRRRDKRLGLTIIAVTFALCMGFSYWAKRASAPKGSAPPGPPSTEGIEGFPTHVDPLRVLPRARTITERSLFRGFVAEGVRSDGTVDFTAHGSTLRFSFQSPPGKGPQPPREGGTLPKRTFCGKQSVQVRAAGLVADADVATYPCPSGVDEPLPEPRCSLAQIWDKARRKGAPEDGKARIEYYRAKEGPAYRFSIPATKHRIIVYGDCERELKGKDSLGHVP